MSAEYDYYPQTSQQFDAELQNYSRRLTILKQSFPHSHNQSAINIQQNYQFKNQTEISQNPFTLKTQSDIPQNNYNYQNILRQGLIEINNNQKNLNQQDFQSQLDEIIKRNRLDESKINQKTKEDEDFENSFKQLQQFKQKLIEEIQNIQYIPVVNLEEEKKKNELMNKINSNNFLITNNLQPIEKNLELEIINELNIKLNHIKEIQAQDIKEMSEEIKKLKNQVPQQNIQSNKQVTKQKKTNK